MVIESGWGSEGWDSNPSTSCNLWLQDDTIISKKLLASQCGFIIIEVLEGVLSKLKTLFYLEKNEKHGVVFFSSDGTGPGRVNFLLLGPGLVSHLWFGYGIGTFPLKIPNFPIFSLWVKKNLGELGQKISRVIRVYDPGQDWSAILWFGLG